MILREFQKNIDSIFGDRDKRRGISKSFNHLVEEIGELSQAMRKNDRDKIEKEFSDVFAWLMTCANLVDIDIENAAGRFFGKCPRCLSEKCICTEKNGIFNDEKKNIE